MAEIVKISSLIDKEFIDWTAKDFWKAGFILEEDRKDWLKDLYADSEFYNMEIAREMNELYATYEHATGKIVKFRNKILYASAIYDAITEEGERMFNT